MIEPSIAAALTRIAERANDVLNGYADGFEPQSSDVARGSALRLPDAGALSATPPEGTYFVVVDHGRTVCTRENTFRFSSGVLCEADGSAVLGWPALGQNARRLVRIEVNPVDARLRRMRTPQIDAKGVVTVMQTVIEPRSGLRREERVVIGRVALARFPAASRPVSTDGRHFLPPNSGGSAYGVPGENGFGILSPHQRELGRVDLEAGLQRLQEAYLSLEALQSAYRAGLDTQKGAMDLLK